MSSGAESASAELEASPKSSSNQNGLQMQQAQHEEGHCAAAPFTDCTNLENEAISLPDTSMAEHLAEEDATEDSGEERRNGIHTTDSNNIDVNDNDDELMKLFENEAPHVRSLVGDRADVLVAIDNVFWGEEWDRDNTSEKGRFLDSLDCLAVMQKIQHAVQVLKHHHHQMEKTIRSESKSLVLGIVLEKGSRKVVNVVARSPASRPVKVYTHTLESDFPVCIMTSACDSRRDPA
jgi:hypothetical protein